MNLYKITNYFKTQLIFLLSLRVNMNEEEKPDGFEPEVDVDRQEEQSQQIAVMEGSVGVMERRFNEE